ncbi:MAG TPA: ATP-dependent Clp protease adapter ClpS [Spirochaetota bacterium]|nr:ATP-dependent Clp protease adapter ClpS [Spirochaetota bacterium]
MAAWAPNHKKNIEILEKDESKVKVPKKYKVILHNDDYTTMDFVVDILINIFRKNLEQATQLMMTVHQQGAAVVGVYTREIAETKVYQVHQSAAKNQYPLKASMEPE